ncbi:MAG TPA: hypothetical protein PKW80_00715 [Bacteroidales bacterium]|nr:hypothetical protein [Bacteroidales bacterium]
MQIISIDTIPFNTFSYKCVGSRRDSNYDGSRIIKDVYLPIHQGFFNWKSQDIDALIIASDLQGNLENNGESKLLGEQIAEYLRNLFEKEFNISPNRVGVILAGDLYATLHKRGGYGDVRQVYINFRNNFKWVVGVNGNHDKIGITKLDETRFKQQENIFILHKTTKLIDGLQISGISGIIGNILKPNRVDECDYLSSLKKMLADKPDIMILHETPDYEFDNFKGNIEITKTIENSPPNLIISGHKFWNEPLREYKNGSQVLNVNARVVILIQQ